MGPESFPGGTSGKEPTANAEDIRDMGSNPESGRSPERRSGNPLQYSCLENPMGRGAWWPTVYRVAKSRTPLKWLTYARWDWMLFILVSWTLNFKPAFHSSLSKIGTIKDRNGVDITEAEDIKRWQEYTEELYKKELHDPDKSRWCDHSPRARHLECEANWALGSITMN